MNELNQEQVIMLIGKQTINIEALSLAFNRVNNELQLARDELSKFREAPKCPGK